jgi:CTP synthase
MQTAPILYEIPLNLERAGVTDYILRKFNLESRITPNWKPWEKMVDDIRKPKSNIKIALVGKYVELHDAYISVREALFHAATRLGVNPEIVWIHAVDLEQENAENQLNGVQGILVPGGFGNRGIEGKIKAAMFARENRIPYLGLCLGMQVMTIDFGRSVLKTINVNSAEFDPSTANPVIDLMPDQQHVIGKGGTMRLGLYPCQLLGGSVAAASYQTDLVLERHRHRFEFNNKYREKFEENGMVFSGLSPDGTLVEIAELKEHPFMLGTQFHPEFLSRPNNPHPLFHAFVSAVKNNTRV